MNGTEVLELKEMVSKLTKTVEDIRTESNIWREETDVWKKEFQDSIVRHNQYEVGVKWAISFGKAILYIGTVIGGMWVFFHDYIVKK